jgi:hypothetical protein
VEVGAGHLECEADFGDLDGRRQKRRRLFRA